MTLLTKIKIYTAVITTFIMTMAPSCSSAPIFSKTQGDIVGCPSASEIATLPAIKALNDFNASQALPLNVVILCRGRSAQMDAKIATMEKFGYWVQGPEDYPGYATTFYLRYDVTSKLSYDFWRYHLWPHENRHKLQALNNPNLASMMWTVIGKTRSVYGGFMEAYADYGFNSTKAYKAQERISALLKVVPNNVLLEQAGLGFVAAYQQLRQTYETQRLQIAGTVAFDQLFAP